MNDRKDRSARFAVRRWQDWIWLACVVIVATTSVTGLIATHQFSWIGVLIAAGLVVGLFAFLAVTNGARLTSLRRQYPHAFVVQLVIYQGFAEQWRAIAPADANGKPAVKAGRSLSVVLDEDSFQLFGGGGQPEFVAKFDSRRITGMAIEMAQQGNWQLNSLELQIDAGDEIHPLDLCIVRWSGWFPHVIRRAELDRALQQAKQMVSSAR